MRLPRQPMRIGFLAMTITLAVTLFLSSANTAQAAPLLANYYLNILSTSASEQAKLAKNNLLILTPSQMAAHGDIVAKLKQINPKLIILAYLPTQSYNNQYWPNDIIFKKMRVDPSWWLKTSSGQIVSTWTGISNINMASGWSDYLINFANNNVANLSGVDGIFFDMVYEKISWAQNGLDMNDDGLPDTAVEADRIWHERMTYFLKTAASNLKTKFIVINGSSELPWQPYVNGRMFENFSTVDRWPNIMNDILKNKDVRSPKLLIINNNTANKLGGEINFQNMRYGLVSSLLEDNIYYSFDFGDRDHGQIWWYDEYGINLGAPAGTAVSTAGLVKYREGVWRRDYDKGIVLVNSSGQAVSVALGGDFEKITGAQDPTINTGEIVDRVSIPSKDGLIMLKTFQTIRQAVFANGYFLRFFNPFGVRGRNGFFAFDATLPGGSMVFAGDINGDGQDEKITETDGNLEILNNQGARWFKDYLLSDGMKGDLRLAVGDLSGSGSDQVFVASTKGGKVLFYNYHGGILRDDFYPLGKKYGGGFNVAIGKKSRLAAFATLNRNPSTVVVFDANLNKAKTTFFPYGKNYKGGVAIAMGDVNGDKKDEIVTLALSGRKPMVRVFTVLGKQIAEFSPGMMPIGADAILGSTDVTFDGKDDIIVESR
ncbi:MAG: putative glycoside hydrolase [bacterium]|nr:putative glycoside hydrolase [bacterium]